MSECNAHMRYYWKSNSFNNPHGCLEVLIDFLPLTVKWDQPIKHSNQREVISVLDWVSRFLLVAETREDENTLRNLRTRSGIR